MLINQTDFIATQLQKIAYPNIKAITETGVPITITTNKKQRDDPAFWQSISAILRAHLWVPVSKKYHELTDHDWLASPASS
ncbi:hypothetical protein BVJ53_05200 [Lacticaseibacillus chiayiensis]|uniref:Uncharacterized protein n=1 Tax=Lacticaseibacillus chiayiensis TaxID=2100821 RepID=A0A4Q1U5E0_9LACO|nr:hypothetical protein [Lacticaseibacillus chiayiensis]QVI34061.1 hypothetical protein KG086_09685 [Lacticaseibacillus chiayiensis]RXT26756.1 hypothetical protein BVJ53_05200 [Lacticaseibacillus chiayiensis]UYN55838.1 hypothetical protein OFW50_10150 [Lacticaseibacillus chiayiensis]